MKIFIDKFENHYLIVRQTVRAGNKINLFYSKNLDDWIWNKNNATLYTEEEAAKVKNEIILGYGGNIEHL